MSPDEPEALGTISRPDRGLRYFATEQTSMSIAVLVMGALSLGFLTVGSAAVVTSYGWTPSANVAAALRSQALVSVLIASAGLGLAAGLLGWTSFRRMLTKPSREAAFSGATVGAISLVLAATFAWFRAGDLEIFSRNFFEFSIVAEFWPRFVRGAANTVVLSVFGEGLGILLGLVFAIFALSQRVVVRAPARAYINFFRGTPLFWQIQFGYFGIVLGLRLDLTPYQVAILILGLNTAAYSAEVFRAGIQSIERGQLEAARSLGMSYLSALRYVVVPLGVRRVIPPLTNEFVILVKDTSLVSILGLTFAEKELLGIGRDIYASTFNATPFLASAAGYLIITIPMIRVVTMLEKKLRSGLTGIAGAAA